MKISLDMLYEYNACERAIALYNKLNLQDIDLNNKKIILYNEFNIPKLKWLIIKFKLTINILYNGKDNFYEIYNYKNGLIQYIRRMNDFKEWYTYENDILVKWENSSGSIKLYKNNLLIYSRHRTKYNGKIIDYIEIYKYDENGLLLQIEDNEGYSTKFIYENNKLIGRELLYNNEIKKYFSNEIPWDRRHHQRKDSPKIINTLIDYDFDDTELKYEIEDINE